MKKRSPTLPQAVRGAYPRSHKLTAGAGLGTPGPLTAPSQPRPPAPAAPRSPCPPGALSPSADRPVWCHPRAQTPQPGALRGRPPPAPQPHARRPQRGRGGGSGARAGPGLPCRGRAGRRRPCRALPHSRSPTSRILTSFFMAPLAARGRGAAHIGLGRREAARLRPGSPSRHRPLTPGLPPPFPTAAAALRRARYGGCRGTAPAAARGGAVLR